MFKQPTIDMRLGTFTEEEAERLDLDSLVQLARSRGAVHASVTKELDGSWRFRAEFTDEMADEMIAFCRYLSDICGGGDVRSFDLHGRPIGTIPGRGRGRNN
jgi:hypothetical protein